MMVTPCMVDTGNEQDPGVNLVKRKMFKEWKIGDEARQPEYE
jgi:hypothetical protein